MQTAIILNILGRRLNFMLGKGLFFSRQVFSRRIKYMRLLLAAARKYKP